MQSEMPVRIERSRSAFRLSATTRDASGSRLVEITFSGGEDGVWFRLEREGTTRIFSRDEVAFHRPLSTVLRLIGDEIELTKKPSEALLAQLVGTLLFYVDRIEIAVPLPRWGRPLRDRRIERALAILDSDLSKYWTVDLLARRVGVSRPVFARQFARMMRLSPMRYLARRRMQLAAELLLTTDASLAEIAARVGFQSEFAFGRAFKRHHRVPPGVYRRSLPSTGAIAVRAAA